MESLSFILSITFTAIIWIAVFGVWILWIIRNKFCSKEDKSQKYLAKPKDIEMDPKNHSEESRGSKSWRDNQVKFYKSKKSMLNKFCLLLFWCFERKNSVTELKLAIRSSHSQTYKEICTLLWVFIT